MDLASIEEIRQLKYRYFRSLDMKEWDEFGDCLAEDVVARYGTQAMDKPLHFDNRNDVVEFMSSNLGTSIISIHIASHPEIAVDGDRATGSWGFEDTVIVPDFKVMIRGGGYYKDEYRKDADGRWRIAATQYERIYEAMTSLEDTPSFKLIANRWDPDLAH
ncbi:MAG: nuclear transport factor 2 family protein [Marmoricola sp.]